MPHSYIVILKHIHSVFSYTSGLPVFTCLIEKYHCEIKVMYSFSHIFAHITLTNFLLVQLKPKYKILLQFLHFEFSHCLIFQTAI